MKKTLHVKSFLRSIVHRKLMSICKLTSVLMLGVIFSTNAVARTQNALVSLNFKDTSLKQVFDEISRQTSYDFMYNQEVIDDSKKITAVYEKEKLSVIMNEIVGGNYDVSYQNNMVIISPKSVVKTDKDKKVSGVIVDENDQPMPGVTVVVKGTSLGVSSDVNGKFELELPIEKGFVIVSFVGYKTKEVAFKTGGNLKIKMNIERSNLDEVKVTAYGKTTRRKTTSAISSVKRKDIEGVPSPSIANLLQGKVAGMDVQNVSGAPGGGGTQITLRGFNSLNVEQGRRNSNPLWVIDGVPMPNFTSPITGTNNLAEIDPETIESIEILKDAASASLYGSRAANGVILVTTKKGRKGDAKFKVNYSKTFSYLEEYPTVTGGNFERDFRLSAFRNARQAGMEFITWGVYDYVLPTNYRDAYFGGYNAEFDKFWVSTDGSNKKGIGVISVLQDSLNSYYNNSTDWFDYYFRRGSITNTNLQASGGSDQFLYNVGLGYYKQEGILKGSEFSRINFLGNFRINCKENLFLNCRFSFTNSDRMQIGNNSQVIGSEYSETIPGDAYSLSTLVGYSPEMEKKILRSVKGNKQDAKIYGIRNSIDLNYEPIRNLRFKSSASCYYSINEVNRFRPSTLNPNGENKTMSQSGKKFMFLNENTLSYNFDINKEHNFNILAGQSYQLDYYKEEKGSALCTSSDYIHYAIKNLVDVIKRGETYEGAQTFFSDYEEKKLFSWIGKFDYDYKQKYMLSATLRRDGSSTFGENVRWANFPSVSAGWAISSEPFMQSLLWLDFAKVRASIGTSGMVLSNPYLSYGLLVAYDPFDGKSTITPKYSDGLYNRELTWEETKQFDLGLDLDLFNYRCNITLDYYLRKTTDMLYKVPVISNVYAYGEQWKNACGIDNEGLEMLIKFDILRNSDLKWNASFNIARNWNKLKNTFNGHDLGTTHILGKPLYQIWGYKTEGIYQTDDEVKKYYNKNGDRLTYSIPNGQAEPFMAGDRKFVDVNEDNQLDSKDLVPLGSSLPEAYGGLINSLSYKGFDLNVSLSYSLGRHISNQIVGPTLPTGGLLRPLFGDLTKMKFWEKEGDDANFPKNYAQGTKQGFRSNLDIFTHKVNYVKLKTVRLTYNLPKNICKKLRVNNLKLLFSAENLGTLTNYNGGDPETVDPKTGIDRWNNYPLSKNFTLGLTVNL